MTLLDLIGSIQGVVIGFAFGIATAVMVTRMNRKH
jgi:hypothetical protein